MRTGQRAVDDFWRLHWDEEFDDVAYDPTEVRGLYDGSEPDSGPSRGGQPALAGNAFYYPYRPEHFVARDEQPMRVGMELGAAWIYLVIAQEWGHSIQSQLKEEYIPDTEELQADCLAAALLCGAHEDGNFVFEKGDLDEVVDATPRTR